MRAKLTGKLTMLFLTFLLLLPFAVSGQDPSAPVKCKWPAITSRTVIYGKNLLVVKPTMSKTEFKSLMSKRLTADKTEHLTCTARAHQMPASISGSCEMRDEIIAPALRAEFLNPKGFYWQWALR